ncbi:MAG: DUF4396 domain-containing protein [Wenzhouxiangella sp.]|jgi:hypothetical protein|nr:DUF4396 domain-containing protein [Wenzhouxiangella sp.]
MNDAQQTNQHGHDSPSRFKTTTHATAHCLLGCSIGEVLGLAIGVTLGIGLWFTLSLAVALAFVFGMGLAVLPLMRGHGMSFKRALATIWLGEAVSIAVMEIAMNGIDYALGGMTAMSVAEPVFWYSLLAAIPAGFLAAWPVNWWLIGKNLRPGH